MIKSIVFNWKVEICATRDFDGCCGLRAACKYELAFSFDCVRGADHKHGTEDLAVEARVNTSFYRVECRCVRVGLVGCFRHPCISTSTDKRSMSNCSGYAFAFSRTLAPKQCNSGARGEKQVAYEQL